MATSFSKSLDGFITIQQILDTYGISKPTCYSYLKKGRVEKKTYKGKTYVDEQQFDAIYRQQNDQETIPGYQVEESVDGDTYTYEQPTQEKTQQTSQPNDSATHDAGYQLNTYAAMAGMQQTIESLYWAIENKDDLLEMKNGELLESEQKIVQIIETKNKKIRDYSIWFYVSLTLVLVLIGILLVFFLWPFNIQ